MKKKIFQITTIGRALVAGVALLGAVGYCTGHVSKKAAAPVMAVGFLASIKNKKEYEALDAGAKKLLEVLDAGLGDLIDSDALEEKLKDINEKLQSSLTAEQKKEFEEISEGYKAMAQKLKKIEDFGLKAESAGFKFFMATENGEESEEVQFKDILQKFRTKKERKFDIVMKTATPADIDSHTIGLRIPGIGQQPVRKPLMMDVFPIVPTNLEYVKYIDQETIVRDAQNVAGIAPSTSSTAVTWKERTVQITKVRDWIPASRDMLEDYDFVMAELQQLLNTSVILKADNGMLKDDGVWPNLHSVNEVASEFDPTNTTLGEWTGKVKNPNIFDLVIAIASQIVVAGKENGYMPDMVLMNTIDRYEAMLIKDDQGRYLLPPFVAVVDNKAITIDGIEVRSNPNVDPNTLYVFDRTKGQTLMRRGIGIELSYEDGTNFRTEVVTMKAYLRMNVLFRNVNKNAFMKCSDVEAALDLIKKSTV